MKDISAIKTNIWSVMTTIANVPGKMAATIASIEEKSKDKSVGTRVTERIGDLFFNKIKFYLILFPGVISCFFEPTPFGEFCVYATIFLPFIGIIMFFLLLLIGQIVDAFMNIVFGFFDLFNLSK